MEYQNNGFSPEQGQQSPELESLTAGGFVSESASLDEISEGFERESRRYMRSLEL